MFYTTIIATTVAIVADKQEQLQFIRNGPKTHETSPNYVSTLCTLIHKVESDT